MTTITAAQFLDVILPAGIHYLGYTNGKLNNSGMPIINCTVFDKGQQAVAKSIRHDTDNQDIYFALASFKQAKIYDEKKGYSKSYRNQDNVDKLKSIWLDVDFKSYSTAEDAKQAIAEFLGNNIPDPTFIVNSGGGQHLYWTFEEEILPAVWQPMSQGLAGFAKQVGLRADFAVTIDSARVLRLPGSHNQKYPDKPEVTIESMGNYASLERMEQLLLPHAAGQAHAGAKITADANVVNLFDPASNSNLSMGYESKTKSSFELIIKECPTIASSWERNGAGDVYQLWKDILHLAAYTDDGEEFIHDISKAYDGYSPEETTLRFDESVQHKINETRGPTLCTRFSATSAACASCKHLGKIKTPWSLGVTRKKEEPTYVRGETTFMMKWELTEQEDGSKQMQSKEVRILDVALTNWKLIPTLRGESPYELWADAKMGSYSSTVKLGMLVVSDSKTLRASLVTNHFGIQENELKLYKEAVMAWINHLKRQEHVDIVDGFGWSRDEESFVVGDIDIHETEDKPVAISEAMASEFTPKGDPKIWTELGNMLCADEEAVFSFMIASGFAGPLMRVGFDMSFVVSVCSKASGVGKSTTMKLVQGAWSDPHKMFSLDDTHNYIIERVGQLKDLPALWDEIRGENAALNLVTTMFRLTQGKSKGRLDSNSSIRGTYVLNTMLLTATNTPITDYVHEYVKQTDAGAARFLEAHMNIKPRPINLKINALVSDLDQNYGHAGRVYARLLVKNRKMLKALIEQTEKELLVTWTPESGERFWFHGIAKIITAAKLLKASGILNIDPDRVREYAMELVASNKEVVQVQEVETSELINDIYSHYQTNALFTEKFQIPGDREKMQILGTVPLRGVEIHVSVEDKKWRISKSALASYAAAHGLQLRGVVATLVEKHSATALRYTPGAGTQVSSAQIRGYEMDLAGTLGEDIISGKTSGPLGAGTVSRPAPP